MSFLLRGVFDRFGAGGSDKTVNHNVIRNDIYIHARLAHGAARLESCVVSRLCGLEDHAVGWPKKVIRCSLMQRAGHSYWHGGGRRLVCNGCWDYLPTGCWALGEHFTGIVRGS